MNKNTFKNVSVDHKATQQQLLTEILWNEEMKP